MPRFTSLAAAATALGLAAACTDPGPESFGDDPTDPQVPARGTTDVTNWLAAGYYLTWHCEAEPHPGRSPSPHGRSRICNNDALHATTSGAFPVGAAAVKEIFDGATIRSYAVARKVTEGTGGDQWYWYEGNPDKIFANGEGAENCTGCHMQAARDFVFTIVP
ncbi:MAG TPA: hypothetical protein VHN14_28385 [Kofleriaceae bacterium]|jgi:hypothetical protein|nr:hypothetical protein [Kofleriaceae bacterium]